MRLIAINRLTALK